jgi:hypothetical protein
VEGVPLPSSAEFSPEKIGFDWVCFSAAMLQAKIQLGLF